MENRRIYCEKFKAKTWIICHNFSKSKSVISFKTLVQGNMLHDVVKADRQGIPGSIETLSLSKNNECLLSVGLHFVFLDVSVT